MASRTAKRAPDNGTGAASGPKNRHLFEGSDWTFETMGRTYDAIQEIALNDLGLDVYPNQIEIISSEQMLDAYSAIGMPLMYQHWSFGKRFVRESQMYRKGFAGLAYEIVINSNPCISYNMEDSTMAVQALVMAHAAFGHNHFFKSNYLFQQWTDAEGILDYLEFAKRYIAKCEESHGVAAVEESSTCANRPNANANVGNIRSGPSTTSGVPCREAAPASSRRRRMPTSRSARGT
jgi:spore cortex formation protein SpoVR/YcgB (stage V sporulation)